MKFKIKLMDRKKAVDGMKKKVWLRLSNLSFFVIMFLLIDEKIKEGYFFRVSDITLIGSHESLITMFAIVGAISYIIHKRREKSNEGCNNS